MGRVPRTVLILGKKWALIDDTVRLDEDDELGCTKPHKCEIYYSRNQDPQQLLDTLHHEIMHAIFHEIGLTYEIKDDKTEVTEEMIVRRFATAQLAFFHDNPNYYKFILGA